MCRGFRFGWVRFGSLDEVLREARVFNGIDEWNSVLDSRKMSVLPLLFVFSVFVFLFFIWLLIEWMDEWMKFRSSQIPGRWLK